MPYALIIQGEVTEIIEASPDGKYHPNLQWVECGNEISTGYRYDGQTFSPPPPEPGLENPANGPDFEGFYIAFEEGEIDDHLATTDNQKAWMRLNVRLGLVMRMGYQPDDVAAIGHYWNQTINGLPAALTPAQVEELRQLAQDFSLGTVFDVLDNGQLEIV